MKFLNWWNKKNNIFIKNEKNDFYEFLYIYNFLYTNYIINHIEKNTINNKQINKMENYEIEKLENDVL